MGIPLDLWGYFEAYKEAAPESSWCQHRELFGDTTNYCPTCGRERPQAGTRYRVAPSFPPALKQAFTLAAFQQTRQTAGIFDSPASLAYHVDKLPNGLTLWNPDGGDAYYLGELITEIFPGDNPSLERMWAVEDLEEIRQEVYEKIKELGILCTEEHTPQHHPDATNNPRLIVFDC